MKKVILLGSFQSTQDYTNELARFKGVTVVGYIDPDDNSNTDIFNDFFQMMQIIEKCDVFIIGRQVNQLDFEIIRQMIRFGKHVFIDGFREWSAAELEEIERLRNESRTVFYFGNTLFQYPITTSAIELIDRPRFVKIEKYARTPQKGNFDQWIFENLSEEFDLVQRMMQSPMRSISARPIFLFGEDPDLLNIHIEFHNDAICQISIGQALDKETHRCSVFQKDNLITIDFEHNQLNESRISLSTDQLTLEMDIYPTKEIGFHNKVTVERHIAPFNIKKNELSKFLERIDKQSFQTSEINHLVSVADLVEVVCEKVKRRYQAL